MAKLRFTVYLRLKNIKFCCELRALDYSGWNRAPMRCIGICGIGALGGSVVDARDMIVHFVMRTPRAFMRTMRGYFCRRSLSHNGDVALV